MQPSLHKCSFVLCSIFHFLLLWIITATLGSSSFNLKCTKSAFESSFYKLNYLPTVEKNDRACPLVLKVCRIAKSRIRPEFFKMFCKTLGCLITLVCLVASTQAADIGQHVGCFKRSSHNLTKVVNLTNCNDFCASQFYRWVIGVLLVSAWLWTTFTTFF